MARFVTSFERKCESTIGDKTRSTRYPMHLFVPKMGFAPSPASGVHLRAGKRKRTLENPNRTFRKRNFKSAFFDRFMDSKLKSDLKLLKSDFDILQVFPFTPCLILEDRC